jgi:hypothetical protein
MEDEMNNHNAGNADEKNSYANLQLLKPQELAKQDFKPIEVAADSTLHLVPDNAEYKDVFARVALDSFDDLQVMGFIPRRLSEEKLRHVIAEDDKLSYQMATSNGVPNSHDCSCNGTAANGTSDLRRSYEGLRKRNNPNMAKLLTDHLGSDISWDSSMAASIRKFALSSRVSREIIALLVSDITINKNATLSVAAASKSLWAHDIMIHRTGRLTYGGSYLRIWANSISRFNDFISEALLKELKTTMPTWK